MGALSTPSARLRHDDRPAHGGLGRSLLPTRPASVIICHVTLPAASRAFWARVASFVSTCDLAQGLHLGSWWCRSSLSCRSSGHAAAGAACVTLPRNERTVGGWS